MCLVLFALRVHPQYPLVLAANRDEYFTRPTEAAARWPGAAGIVAGRDEVAGGTWLGASARGRFAVLTNFRDTRPAPPDAPSRGSLVVGALESSEPPERHLRSLQGRSGAYAGFSLLVGTGEEVFYLSNREGRVRRVAGGVHGLSNHCLDTPWPKVSRGRERLSSALAAARGPTREAVREDLVRRAFELLDDRALAPDSALPSTGVSLELERALSAARILTPGYGTRSSTVLLADRAGSLHLVERTLAVGGQAAGERHFALASPAAVRRD